MTEHFAREKALDLSLFLQGLNQTVEFESFLEKHFEAHEVLV